MPRNVDHLLETFNNIPRVDRSEVFIIGDLNINYGDLSNTNRKLLKDFEAFTGMKQLINHPTRFGQSASTIDLLPTNSGTIVTSGVIPINLSDHELVFVTSKKEKLRTPKKEVHGRSYIHYDAEQFQSTLLGLDWSYLHYITDVDHYWNEIECKIRKTMDDICLLKKCHVRVINESWITQELLEGIQDKHNLRKIAVNTGNQADWARARLAKNEIKTTLKKAKADFFKDNLSKHNNDPKKYWEQIKQLLNPQNSNSFIAL